jgi:hypothetical protein
MNLKERYETGNYICFKKDGEIWDRIESPNFENKKDELRFIIKRHEYIVNEIEDDNKVMRRIMKGSPWENIDNFTFFEKYHESYDYIPVVKFNNWKQDKNRFFIKSSKKAFDKLIEEGLEPFNLRTNDYNLWDYYIVIDGTIEGITINNKDIFKKNRKEIFFNSDLNLFLLEDLSLDYPKFFKNKYDVIVKFSDLRKGVVIKGDGNLQSYTGFKWECFHPHDDESYWTELTEDDFLNIPFFDTPITVEYYGNIYRILDIEGNSYVINNLKLDGFRKKSIDISELNKHAKVWIPEVEQTCLFWNNHDGVKILDNFHNSKFVNQKRIYVSKHKSEFFSHCIPYYGNELELK